MKLIFVQDLTAQFLSMLFMKKAETLIYQWCSHCVQQTVAISKNITLKGITPNSHNLIVIYALENPDSCHFFHLAERKMSFDMYHQKSIRSAVLPVKWRCRSRFFHTCPGVIGFWHDINADLNQGWGSGLFAKVDGTKLVSEKKLYGTISEILKPLEIRTQFSMIFELASQNIWKTIIASVLRRKSHWTEEYPQN